MFRNALITLLLHFYPVCLMAFSVVYSDQRYLQAVRDGDDRLVGKFYDHVYKMAYTSIRQHGIEDEDDIREVYQESFVTFYSKVKRDDFGLSSQLSTYLIGICINQAKTLKRKLIKKDNGPFDVSEADELTEDYEQIEESKRLIFIEEFEKMKTTGDECYQLIKLAFMEGKQNSTIAHILSKKNADVVKTQKSRCLTYLRRKIFKRLHHA